MPGKPCVPCVAISGLLLTLSPAICAAEGPWDCRPSADGKRWDCVMSRPIAPGAPPPAAAPPSPGGPRESVEAVVPAPAAPPPGEPPYAAPPEPAKAPRLSQPDGTPRRPAPPPPPTGVQTPARATAVEAPAKPTDEEAPAIYEAPAAEPPPDAEGPMVGEGSPGAVAADTRRALVRLDQDLPWAQCGPAPGGRPFAIAAEQPAETAEGELVYISADAVDLLQTEEVVELQGRILVDRGIRHVEADWARYDLAEHLLDAS